MTRRQSDGTSALSVSNFISAATSIDNSFWLRSQARAPWTCLRGRSRNAWGRTPTHRSASPTPKPTVKPKRPQFEESFLQSLFRSLRGLFGAE